MVYSVDYIGRLVGSAEVKKQGLYYFISCICDLPTKEIYRLFVSCGEHSEDLGILVPQNNGYGIKRQIPVKKIGEGKLTFFIVPQKNINIGTFWPVYEDEGFVGIDSLEFGRLEIRDGKIGIVITNPHYKEISNPTGQWSEPSISE